MALKRDLTLCIGLISRANQGYIFNQYDFNSNFIRGLGIKSWQLFIGKIIDHEQTWKYINGSGWC